MNAVKANDTPKERVGAFRQKLGLSAKANPKRSYGNLYDKVYRPDVLREAWDRVSRNGGAAGVDGKSIGWIRKYGVEKYLEELGTELREERYRPERIKRVFIPKPDGRERPLGIPTVMDRVVQMAVKLMIEPLFEADFLDCSYGFRPGRSSHQAIEAVDDHLRRGYRWVVDVDLASYFDTIPHDRLLDRVKRRVHDLKILRLLKAWLKAGVLTDGGVEYPELGSPQGGVLSPLLSNIYLHDLDQACRDRGPRTPMVRYADDLVILCRTPAEAHRSHQWLAGQVQAMGLGLNEAKTRVVSAREGFDFLGFSYRPGRYLWQGQPRTTVIKVPRDRAKQAIRTRIKEAVKAIPLGASVHEVVKSVNARLKGWANYFRISNLYPALKRLVWHAETQIRLFLRRAYQCKRVRGTRRFPSRLIHQHLGLYTANALCGRS